ncbi:hypothetical protein [Pedobacter panaciterrae]|uniref:hypothetical protein n=1 Tax=Pedobacter panaciterrae TaxID=363849 RepID=UPI002591456B|nr:hypothetical protein [uncultured Pedobacter sp.]
MYDGIVIRFPDLNGRPGLLNNPNLEFFRDQKETGEVITESDKLKYNGLNFSHAEYKGLHFRVYDNGSIIIRGSLHKYFNEGKHNLNRFTIKDVKMTLQNLNREFGINLEKARVNSLEIGVNLSTSFSVKKFIDRLIVYNNKPFEAMDCKGHGRQTQRQGVQYYLKIYDKGTQYISYTNENILRYEVKIIKMEYIRKGPIYLADLLEAQFVDRSIEIARNCFQDILIKEIVNRKKLTEKEELLYSNCINPLYWQHLKDKSKRCRDKQKYSALLKTYSNESLKELTLSAINSELKIITSNNFKICNVLTDFKDLVPQRFDSLDIQSNSNGLHGLAITCNPCDLSLLKKDYSHVCKTITN